MLPFKIDMSKVQKTMTPEQQRIKTGASQQAIVNSLVIGSTPTNPNAGQIQQLPLEK